MTRSPFGGIPRNWKHQVLSLALHALDGSPFGRIPRNWKQKKTCYPVSSGLVALPSGNLQKLGRRLRNSE